MKKISKKLLSLALAMSIILSMFMGMNLTVKAEGTSPKTWAELKTALANGVDVTLDQNITAGSGDTALVVPSGKTVILDLKGHIIDRKLATNTAEGYVIKVEGNLTLNDSSGNNSGTITGGKNEDKNTSKGGGVYIATGGTLTMNGGTITGNDGGGAGPGGGVYVSSSTSFTMNGGVITDNTAYTGGGVWHGGSSSFTMNGGVISDNTARHSGGGVYNNNGDFSMSGGTITGNTAVKEGGGVYSSGDFWKSNTGKPFGTFTMTGDAKVINNSSSATGGGVYIKGAKFTVGGTAQVTGNTLDGATNNAGLNSEALVELGTDENTPATGMSIGINYENTLPANGYTLLSSGADSDILNYFFADDPTQKLELNSDALMLKLLDATGEIKIDDGGNLTVGGNQKDSGALAAMGLAYSFDNNSNKATLTLKKPTDGSNLVIRGKDTDDTAIHSMVDLEIKLETNATVLYSVADKDAIIVGNKSGEGKNLTISGNHTLNVQWTNGNVTVSGGVGIYANNLTVNSGTTLKAQVKTKDTTIEVNSLSNNGTLNLTNSFGNDGSAVIGFKGTLDNRGTIDIYAGYCGIKDTASGPVTINNYSNITVNKLPNGTPTYGIFINREGSRVALDTSAGFTLMGSTVAYIGPEITAIPRNYVAKVLGNKDYYEKPNTPAIFGEYNNGYKIYITYLVDNVDNEIAQALKVTCVPAPIPDSGSGPGNYYPTNTSPNISVSGDSSISVNVSVNGNKVTVGDITAEALNSIIKSDSNNKENTEITIDLSALNNIKQTVFTKETLNNISKVLNDNSNNKTSFEIKLKDSTVNIDAKALGAITSKAGGKDIGLNINIASDKISVSIESNGKEITDFGSGRVNVGINNFTVEPGKKSTHYHVYYKPKNGEAVRRPTWFEKGTLYFTL